MRGFRELPDKFFYGKKDTAKKLGDVFSELGLKKNKLINDDIVKVWDNFIDSSIKEHCNIVSVKKGSLYLEVDSNPWLHHISNFCKHEILNIFQENSKKTFISDIKFKVKSGK